MGSGEVCGVAGKFTMLVAPRNARRGQQRSCPRQLLAVAAHHAAVSVLVFGRAGTGGNRLPACPCAERAPPAADAFLAVGLRVYGGRSFIQLSKSKLWHSPGRSRWQFSCLSDLKPDKSLKSDKQIAENPNNHAGEHGNRYLLQ